MHVAERIEASKADWQPAFVLKILSTFLAMASDVEVVRNLSVVQISGHGRTWERVLPRPVLVDTRRQVPYSCAMGRPQDR